MAVGCCYYVVFTKLVLHKSPCCCCSVYQVGFTQVPLVARLDEIFMSLHGDFRKCQPIWLKELGVLSFINFMFLFEIAVVSSLNNNQTHFQQNFNSRVLVTYISAIKIQDMSKFQGIT